MRNLTLRYFGWQNYLIKLKNGDIITQMSKKLDLTYTHASDITRLLKISNLIVTVKKGRIKRVFLTPAGEEVQINLLKIKQKIKEVKID